MLQIGVFQKFKIVFKIFNFFSDFSMNIMKQKIGMFIVSSQKKMDTEFELNIMHNREPCGYHESVPNLLFTIGL